MSKASPSLDGVLGFYSLLQQYRAIERRVLVKDSDRRENDVEHSFSLAMLAWYVNQSYALNMDTEKLLKYALAHDLVEVYAGDTYFYSEHKDPVEKKEREEKAARKLQEELSEFPELHTAIANYEKREDRESKFIYALDKIEPMVTIYLDGGRSWRKDNISLEMIKTGKVKKIAEDETVEALFNQLIERLEAGEKELFPGNAHE